LRQEFSVTNAPIEPTNLVLEQLRLMRAEMLAMGAQTNAHFDRLESDISDIKKDLRGFKLNTIAEICKANLTVASFVDHEQRTQALERKSS
jgi:hypothetical protein